MSRFVLPILALAALAAMGLQAQFVPNLPGVVFGATQSSANKSFWAVDTSTTTGSVTLVANMATYETTQDPFPYNCYGYSSSANTGPGAPLNLFAPNALGYDGISRVFFVAWNSDVARAARLCFLNIISAGVPGAPAFFYVQDLPDAVVSGAAFLQEQYIFVYIREGAPSAGILTLIASLLDRVTGKATETVVFNQFRDRTGPNPDAVGPINFFYIAGDQTVDCSAILYGSSVGNMVNGAPKRFFSLQLTPGESDIYDYSLIHQDTPPDSSLTGFATAEQLAFSISGALISQNAGLGIFSVVNTATGANGELGTEGVDYVRFFDPESGALLTFTDLASAQDCGFGDLCIRLEVQSACQPEVMDFRYIPSPSGTIPCAPVERFCVTPPECTDEIECVYYVPTEEMGMM
ncbi:hypothetical protein FVE85_1430 [Porphyridium purpureum]|uniref:Uncharacterized protein n=1 Tax=Porphyridium purpureum TaxID=35688 RepID=A0A5J4YVH6_PORPP|nr:hypothetical protein FVE85_1430 [Porphyridium purpureum]|eukprot:POR4774..scf209_3